MHKKTRLKHFSPLGSEPSLEEQKKKTELGPWKSDSYDFDIRNPNEWP